MLDILIVMNNYLHDVATATLLASAVIMWVLGRRAEEGGPAESATLARAFPTLTKFAWGAVAWIVVGGIPRTIFFYSHEFVPAATAKGPYMLPALAVKHTLMTVAVVAGALLWRRMARAARGNAPVAGQ